MQIARKAPSLWVSTRKGSSASPRSLAVVRLLILRFASSSQTFFVETRFT